MDNSLVVFPLQIYIILLKSFQVFITVIKAILLICSNKCVTLLDNSSIVSPYLNVFSNLNKKLEFHGHTGAKIRKKVQRMYK